MAIYMEHFGLDREEAEKRIANTPLDSDDEVDEESEEET